MKEAIKRGIIHGVLIGSWIVLGYLFAREIMRGSM